jgi:ribosomal protein S18 acetylase RimI-like enzyme
VARASKGIFHSKSGIFKKRGCTQLGLPLQFSIPIFNVESREAFVGSKHQIPSQWNAKRLVIQDSIKDEVDQLQVVYDKCNYIGKWTGAKDISRHPMLSEFNHQDLPPKGLAKFHRLQSIRIKASGKLIGYVISYHGFPNNQTFWIASLAIHPKFQKNQFGQELVMHLSKEVTKLKAYKAIGLSVGIKNWPALRFWIKAGFNSIGGFNGAKYCTEKTFATIWLKKKLKRKASTSNFVRL